MKKIFTLALLVLFGIAANAQTPDVTITVTNTTTTTVSADFTPNSYCSSYYILMSEQATMAMYQQMMQCSLNDLVIAWGIEYTGNDSYTWTEMIPATEYTVYVAAIGGGDTVLVTQTANTLSQGGSGVSVISIQVTDLTDNSARVICTPNSETSVFFDQVVTKEYYESVVIDTIIAIVQSSPYPLYETDDWVWSGLESGTDYYALAMGQNANGEWGELTVQPFSTTGTSVADNAIATLCLYPNPASNVLNIKTAIGNKLIEVVNLLGQTIYSDTSADESIKLNICDWKSGVYFVRIKSDSGVAFEKFIKK